MNANPKNASLTLRKKMARHKERSDAAMDNTSDITPSHKEPQQLSGPWKIPTSWWWSKMGDIAAVVGGGTPKSDQAEYLRGDIPWITPADLSGYTEKFISTGARSITSAGLNNSGAKVMPAGAVLFSSRAPIGYVAVAANPVSTNQGFKSFVLRDGLTSDFVYYYLQHAKKLAIEMASGTTFLEISGQKAAQLPIPVAPLSEQRRIVAEIEKQFTRLEAGVAALRRVQANLKRYRAAVLKAACEGRLVPTEAELAKTGNRKAKFETGQALLARILTERCQNWQGRGKYKEPAAPDATNLQPLPEGWTWASVGQVGEVKGGKRLPAGHDYSPKPTAFPYIRVVDFENYGVRQNELRYLRQETQSEIQRYTISKNDVYISIAGSIGVVGVVPENLDGANLTENAAKITSLSFVERKYICFWLSSPAGRSCVADKTIATIQSTLALFRIEAIPFPLPPLAEQTRIVAEVERRFSVVEELEAVVSTNLQRGTRLRQSILQEAFTGKLTKL